jgi:hypothetical protein
MAPDASAVEVMSNSRRESFRFRMTWIPDSIDSLSAYSITSSGARERRRFVSLTRSSMLLDWLAIAVSVLLSAGIRNAWGNNAGDTSPAQGSLIAS